MKMQLKLNFCCRITLIFSLILLIGFTSGCVGNSVNSSPENVAKGIMQAAADNDVNAFLKCISKQQLQSVMAVENKSEDQVTDEISQNLSTSYKSVKKYIGDMTFDAGDSSSDETNVNVKTTYAGSDLTIPTYKDSDGNWYVYASFLQSFFNFK